MSTEFLESVRALDRALADYARENPHVMPYSVLQESDGVESIVSGEAAALWEELATAAPTDGLVHHHLAVIRHGAAFQALDQGEHSAAAIADWEAGLQHWRNVVESDELWDHLTAVWSQRRDSAKGEKLAGRLLDVDLRAFRKALPAQLLKIHVDIIQATLYSNPDAARAHVRLIRESGFDNHRIREAMNQVYSLCVGGRMRGEPDQAIEATEAYLQIDPDSTRALQDRLRIAIRICEDKSQDFSHRTGAMKAAIGRAKTLQNKSRQQDARADGTCDVLRDYFLTWATLCNSRGVQMPDTGKKSNDLFREAFELLEQACTWERTGVSARSLFVTVSMNIAKTCSDTIKQSAKLLKRATTRFPKDARLHLALAHVQLYDGDAAAAEQSITTGERMNQHTMDHEANKELAELRQLVSLVRDFGSMKVVDLVSESVQLMEQRKWNAALAKLNGAFKAQNGFCEGTLRIVERMFVCHENTGNTDGQRMCQMLHQTVRAKLSERA